MTHWPDDSLHPEELSAILRAADAALAQAEVQELEDRMRATGRSVGLLPPVPDIAALQLELEALAAMRAPFYLNEGSLLPRLVKQLANLPIRLTGSKQAIFNTRLLQLLERYRHAIEVLTQAAAYQAQMAAMVERQAAEIAALREDVRRLQEERQAAPESNRQ